MTETLFLVHIRRVSNYQGAKVGDFIKTREFDGLHVYKGRLLTIDEFNALPESIWERTRSGGYPVQVRAFVVPVPEPEPKLSTDEVIAQVEAEEAAALAAEAEGEPEGEESDGQLGEDVIEAFKASTPDTAEPESKKGRRKKAE